MKSSDPKTPTGIFHLAWIFFAVKGGRQWFVLSWLCASGFMGGLGLATLAPVISLISGEEADDANRVTQAISKGLITLGLEPNLGVLLAIVILGINLQAFLLWVGMRRVGYAVADVVFNYRSQIFKNLVSAKWDYFSDLPLGRLTSAVVSEASACGNAYIIAANMLAQAIKGAIYIGLALFISLHLALVSLALAGLIALILGRQVQKSRKAGQQNLITSRELMVHLSDALACVKPLKAMERQQAYAAKINKKISRIRKTTKKAVHSKQTLSNFQAPLLFTSLGIGCYVLIEVIGMPVSDVLVTGFLIERTVKVTNSIQKYWQAAAASEYAFSLVHRLIDDSAAHSEKLDAGKDPDLRRSLRFDNVFFSYGDKPVLEGLNIEVPARKLTLLTGSSGAGKTTVTDLLIGFHQPNSGRILIDDLPLSETNIRKWRQMIGYVPQELFLFNDSVLENVTLGDSSLTPDAAEQALKAAGAWDFVAKLPNGMYSPVGERGAKLSGGQRQRIAVARALVHQPKLLILDEATSALDSETEEEICRNIKKLSAQITVLAVSHRSGWMDVADQIIEIRAASAYQEQPSLREREAV